MLEMREGGTNCLAWLNQARGRLGLGDAADRIMPWYAGGTKKLTGLAEAGPRGGWAAM